MSTGWTMNDPRLVFREEDHSYHLGERRLPSVTQILSDAGVFDFSDPHFTDDVKERGRLIHLAIALDNDGDLDDESLDQALVPYVAGWRQFKAETGITVEHWETPIADPDLGFAGTLDGIVVFPRQQVARRTVIDIKRTLYPSAGPQVAAYLRCARALYNTPTLFNRAALVLPGDGSYRLQPLIDPNDEHVFLAALRLFHFRRQHGLAA